jgi:hypothetical protein
MPTRGARPVISEPKLSGYRAIDGGVSLVHVHTGPDRPE